MVGSTILPRSYTRSSFCFAISFQILLAKWYMNGVNFQDKNKILKLNPFIYKDSVGKLIGWFITEKVL